MHPLVKKLEERLLPEFERVADQIRREIRLVNVRVYSREVGLATEYQGYGFYIDCIFTRDCGEADNVALSVGLFNLTTEPKIFADVVWGHPSGYCEAEFPARSSVSTNDFLVAADEAIADLYRNLPRLYDALMTALKRRKPTDEC